MKNTILKIIFVEKDTFLKRAYIFLYVGGLFCQKKGFNESSLLTILVEISIMVIMHVNLLYARLEFSLQLPRFSCMSLYSTKRADNNFATKITFNEKVQLTKL